MEFHGKVIELCEIRKGVSARNGEAWESQDFVVEKDGRYPVRVCFNVFGSDRIKSFALKVGEFVTVHFDISARCSQGKWFNDVSAYKIERGPRNNTNLNNQAETAVAQTFEEMKNDPDCAKTEPKQQDLPF